MFGHIGTEVQQFANRRRRYMRRESQERGNEIMSRRGWQAGAIVAAVALVGWLGWGNDVRGGGNVAEAAAVTAQAEVAAMNTITVGASGSILVDPDIAYANVAVETKGATAGAAQEANAKQFAAVEKVLYETFKLDKKDVKTSGFYVQPEYNYTEKDGRKLVGYTAVHQIQVSYRKLDEIGKLLDALSAAGANRIDGVRFSTEKGDQYELEALKKAMANAKAKADTLASSAGRQVKGVVNIVQGAASAPPIFMEATMAKAMAVADSAVTSVQAGQIEISANVTVQYQM